MAQLLNTFSLTSTIFRDTLDFTETHHSMNIRLNFFIQLLQILDLRVQSAYVSVCAHGLIRCFKNVKSKHSKLNFFICEILHWSRIYVQNFQKWAPKLRFFQISGFFSDFQDFGVIKSTFLIFLNYFWKFWGQIRDQWRIWAEKCTLLFEFCRFSVKNRKIPGF